MPFLQSITSFFGGSSSTSGNDASGSRHNPHQAARRSVMDSTFDAFSLPTSRYNDTAYVAEGPHSVNSSPGPSRQGSTYGYPPAQTSYQPSTNLHPPLSHTYYRLRAALSDPFPELLETLNGPVDASLLASFEQELGCPLPPSVRESFIIADGQDLDSGCGGLFFGLHLLPLEDVMREWAFWRQAEHDPDSGKNPAVLATMASIPPKWIKQLYACRGWIPLLSDRTGNYVGVDLDPDQGGSWGQVIIFGRDFDRKCVIWRGDGEGGWGKFLASFVDELESGDGWEADKSSSSDDEEELGYGSYNGGATAGEEGKGLKLAGEYRGWNVLEAWWDKSVRQWEQLGLGMDVEEIERGMSEARRLAGLDNVEEEEAGPSGSEDRNLRVEIPVYVSPQITQQPSTPVPGDSDILLPPASPEQPSTQFSKAKQKLPIRVITPVATTSDHPLQAGPSQPSDRDLGSGYLSPADVRGRRARPPPPAPTPLDLPTRADIQATAAIAQAEASGLRGGWVMNIDPGIDARRRHGDSEMVDIDLEGGRGEKFGSPRVSAEEMERLREEEKLNLAGMGQHSPRLLYQSRTPSPLLRNHSLEIPSQSPTPPRQGLFPQSVLSASSTLRRPPPIASGPDSTVRRLPQDEDPTVYRNVSLTFEKDLRRTQRESSVFSETSHDGLLDDRSLPSRSVSPAFSEPVASPVTITGQQPSPRPSTDSHTSQPRRIPHSRKATAERIDTLSSTQGLDGLEDDMQEVSLDGNGSVDMKSGAGGRGGFQQVTV